MNEIIEWLAFLIGTIGTVCWAAGWKYRGKPVEGWFWLVSALLWIWFAQINKHNGLAARDILGLTLYIAGIFKSFKKTNIEPLILPSLIEKEICQFCSGSGVHQLSGPGSTSCKCINLKN